MATSSKGCGVFLDGCGAVYFGSAEAARSRILWQVLLGAALLGAWQALVNAGFMDKFFFSRPRLRASPALKCSFPYFQLSSRQVLGLYRKRSGRITFGRARNPGAGAFPIQP
jgi:hypothetical protein